MKLFLLPINNCQSCTCNVYGLWTLVIFCYSVQYKTRMQSLQPKFTDTIYMHLLSKTIIFIMMSQSWNDYYFSSWIVDSHIVKWNEWAYKWIIVSSKLPFCCGLPLPHDNIKASLWNESRIPKAHDLDMKWKSDLEWIDLLLNLYHQATRCRCVQGNSFAKILKYLMPQFFCVCTRRLKKWKQFFWGRKGNINIDREWAWVDILLDT